jgi:hypothetical protein
VSAEVVSAVVKEVVSAEVVSAEVVSAEVVGSGVVEVVEVVVPGHLFEHALQQASQALTS